MSIMGLMKLAAGQGGRLTFRVSGEGGEELLGELGRLFDRRFEES
jgi:phosphotransferase system HPr-like phosphotransfer protein